MVDLVNPLEAGFSGVNGSVSSSSRVSGNTFDPVALAAAMSSGVALTQAGGSIDTAIADIGKAAIARKQAEEQQMVAIKDYATKQGDAVAAQAAVDAGEALRRKNILTVGNINPEQADNAYANAVRMVNETAVELERQGSDIDSRMAVGLFDNPLQWLVNQVQLPGLVGQYNAVVEKQNRSIETARSLQQLANTQLGISQNMDADAITKAGTARAAADASAAQAKLSEVQAAAAGATARDIATVQAMQGNKFSINLQLAQLTKEKFATGEYASEKEAAKAAEQMQLDMVNQYMARIGSATRYDPITFKAIPASRRDALLSRAGTPVIAENFDEAAAIINAEGNADRIAEEGDSAAMNWFRGTIQESRDPAAVKAAQVARMSQPGAKPVSDEVMQDTILRQKKDVYAAETTDMRKASKNNPYKLAYDFFASGLAAGEKTFGSTAFKNNVVTNYIREFGPTSANPAWTTLDEAVMLDKVAQDVASGKLTSGDAARQISDFYRTANKLQLDRTKYPLFGMSELKSYTIKVPETSSFWSSNSQIGATLDLTNQAAIEAYFTKDVAAKLKSKNRFDSLLAVPPAM